MSNLLLDLRYAVRTMIARPAFAVIVVLTVAIGVGATTTMFGIVYGVLLRPLPYPEAERLVVVSQSDRFNDTQREGVSGPDYFDYLEQQTVFERMAAWTGLSPTLTGALGSPERLSATRATHTLFATLGARPAIGRGFSPDEDTPGGARVAVLSHGLWLRGFGGDSAVLGKQVRLDGDDYTVVGVLPSHFGFRPATDVWLPLQYGPTTGTRGVHDLGVVARLRTGATVAMARAEMSRIMANLEQLYADDNVGRGATVDTLETIVIGSVRPALLLLMGAVVLVLLITCANVANMLLARGAARHREIAVRAALGANRGRIVGQLLAESGMLALAGGAAGIAIAFAGVRVVRVLEPGNLPRVTSIDISAPVLVFALAVTILTGLFFGLLPALRSSSTNLNQALTDAARGSSGITAGTLRSTLVITQVAVAFVLVVGAGLLIESMWNLTRVDPGFQYRNLVKVSVNLPQARYPSSFRNWPNAPEVKRFYAEVLARASRIGSVTHAALAVNHPLNGGWTSRVVIEGGPTTVEEGVEEERIRPVSPSYFATIGAALVRGRDFTDFDRGESPGVAIVNESFVRKYFTTEDPIGRRLQFWSTMREIVGVVADVKFMGLDAPTVPAVYAPMAQLPFSGFDIVVRGRAPADQLIEAMRAEIRQIDPELAMFAGQSFESILATSLGSQRFNMIMLGVFATLALTLAAVGIYGVISYGVNRRVREFGVRMSLGADRGRVSRLVLSQGVKLTAVGIGVGLLGAILASRTIAGLLYGVAPVDPVTLTGVAIFLTAVAMAASLIPARRASRVDPMVALRQE